jgi:hypothetical protein
VIRVADCALNAISFVALRCAPPARARTIVSTFACVLPRLSPAEGRALADRLDQRGTCLSRALTVASRVDGAQVAIGVRYEAGSKLSAHAWVVCAGAPLRPADPVGDVIALLDVDDDWSAHDERIRRWRET